MLNQNDFRKILSTPVPNASGGGKGIGGGNDKTRFDMKQIASWSGKTEEEVERWEEAVQETQVATRYG